jgi:hypothetical protein
MKKMLNKLYEIKQIINEAEAILITAGAGMGVDVVPFIFQNMDNRKTPHLLAS